jgi:hypothetical protein
LVRHPRLTSTLQASQVESLAAGPPSRQYISFPSAVRANATDTVLHFLFLICLAKCWEFVYQVEMMGLGDLLSAHRSIIVVFDALQLDQYQAIIDFIYTRNKAFWVSHCASSS